MLLYIRIIRFGCLRKEKIALSEWVKNFFLGMDKSAKKTYKNDPCINKVNYGNNDSAISLFGDEELPECVSSVIEREVVNDLSMVRDRKINSVRLMG